MVIIYQQIFNFYITFMRILTHTQEEGSIETAEEVVTSEAEEYTDLAVTDLPAVAVTDLPAPAISTLEAGSEATAICIKRQMLCLLLVIQRELRDIRKLKVFFKQYSRDRDVSIMIRNIVSCFKGEAVEINELFGTDGPTKTNTAKAVELLEIIFKNSQKGSNTWKISGNYLNAFDVNIENMAQEA
jgi:hypothetical protein